MLFMKLYIMYRGYFIYEESKIYFQSTAIVLCTLQSEAVSSSAGLNHVSKVFLLTHQDPVTKTLL